MRFATPDDEVGVRVGPDNFRGMIPILIRAEAQRYKNAGMADAVRASAASDASVPVCSDWEAPCHYDDLTRRQGAFQL